jgi:hypothetical protein
MIAMSNLGKRGRFGNQVFQYAFLKIYTSHYSLGLETGRWVGQLLFGHAEPAVTHSLPVVGVEKIAEAMKKETLFTHKTPPFDNVDLNGPLMFHTRYYRPFRSYFRSLFQPVPGIFKKVNHGLTKLRQNGKTIIGIHLRRGDFINYQNHHRNVIVPNSWYWEWLDQIWPTLEKPLLFLASDDLPGVLPDFKRYQPLTSNDVIDNFPQDPSYYPEPSFYPDFYLLSQCDRLAISNSSFSFAASLLNKHCQSFVRPHSCGRLVSYDPWDSHVKLNFPVKGAK